MFCTLHIRGGAPAVATPCASRDEADRVAARQRRAGGTVTVFVDVATADREARAMAFAPPPALPLAGRAGYGTWRPR